MKTSENLQKFCTFRQKFFDTRQKYLTNSKAKNTVVTLTLFRKLSTRRLKDFRASQCP